MCIFGLIVGIFIFEWFWNNFVIRGFLKIFINIFFIRFWGRWLSRGLGCWEVFYSVYESFIIKNCLVESMGDVVEKFCYRYLKIEGLVFKCILV